MLSMERKTRIDLAFSHDRFNSYTDPYFFKFMSRVKSNDAMRNELQLLLHY